MLVAIATPILGFYGALNPEPHDSSNFNWVAAAWTIGLLVLALIWFLILLVMRRDKIDDCGYRMRPSTTASHRSTRRSQYESAGDTTPL